ncbi:MAG: acyl-CoA dehydrogenase family protein [Actinomycetota bacterium]|nr:acyl-CoA dehydrogenase family protein [Actinomycetota bacterium]
MDFDYPAETESFRQEVRAFLEANWDPGHYAQEAEGLSGPGGPVGTGFAAGAWHAKLQEARLVAVHWPEEFGGRGLGMTERLILIEELNRVGAPGPGNPIGVGWAGPTILQYGSEEQKRRFLPKILTGEEIWCQLFSEPNAGSDLASLATRAERVGDEFVVSGQKVWTSLGFSAHWGILLARTDPEVPKHRGLTYFLLPMRQPGVEVRPLRQMTGGEEFCEVFLDQARVPAANVLGEIGSGWRAAMTTLLNERISLTSGTGALWGGGPSLTDFLKLAKAAARGPDRLMDDPNYRQLAARLYIEDRVLGFVRLRVLSALVADRDPGFQAAIQKLMADRFGKRLMAAAMEVLGPHGLLWHDRRAPDDGAWADGFLFSPGLSIGGGTEEVQKNILGERALGLPQEPRPDKDVPYRKLGSPS